MPVHVVSARTGRGLRRAAGADRARARPRCCSARAASASRRSSTASSGSERMATGETRADDDEGRHTTSHRELILLPGGGIVIDTPGLRELQLARERGGLRRERSRTSRSSRRECRFNDCSHEGEPGCAVLAAVEDGPLAPERLESWRKLQRELHAIAIRKDAPAAQGGDPPLEAPQPRGTRAHPAPLRRKETARGRRIPRVHDDEGSRRSGCGRTRTLALVPPAMAAGRQATTSQVRPQVAGLQVALRAWGLYDGPIDAIDGPGTRAAVRAFQQRAGLPVDGVAGGADARRARAARPSAARAARARAGRVRLGRLRAPVRAHARRRLPLAGRRLLRRRRRSPRSSAGSRRKGSSRTASPAPRRSRASAARACRTPPRGSEAADARSTSCSRATR